MLAYTEMKIDSTAIIENLKEFKGAVMPMIKGGGYGLGMMELAELLDPHCFPFLGVSHLSEGIALRDAGIRSPIFLLSFLPEMAPLVIEHRLTPSVDTVEKIEALDWAAQGSYPVHLEINVGMNRFGGDIALNKAIESAPHLYLEGISGHLPSAKSPKFDDVTHEQIAFFERCVASLSEKPRWVHLFATGGYTRFNCDVCNLSRIGLRMFSPRPVCTLESRILTIRDVKKGEAIGYEGLPLSEPKKIATIGIGYHDGWKGQQVAVNGVTAPIIGQVCMDFMFVDVTHCPPVAVGDVVELIGPHRPLEVVAQEVGLNPRKILSELSPRILRTWHEESVSRTRSVHETAEAAR